MRKLARFPMLWLAAIAAVAALSAVPALPAAPILASPPVGGLAGASGPSIPTAFPVGPVAAPHPTLPDLGSHHSISGSRSGSIAPRFGENRPPGGPLPASALATKGGPRYDWSSAFIFYGNPPPPADLQLGEGAGLVTDNARNETLIFGGHGAGGLSNLTFIYDYYYNASYPLNSSEYAAFTASPTSPSARTNASFGANQSSGEALLFGGLTNLRSQSTVNDTWLYYFGNDTWRNITQPAAPPPREEAAFAVDQKDGIALVFGGIAPQYTSKGSTGTVIWQDTWEFHFGTGRWTQIVSPSSPTDRFGASMVWDPVTDTFLLVGGCSFTCSMDAWAFSVANSSWAAIAESGTIPLPRASASFAWDPGANQAVLFGGLSYDSNGNAVVYSDTYVFLPNGAWTKFNAAAPGPAPIYQPGPMYDASTAWANFPGCDAMWVLGGNPSLTGPPEFVYVIQPTNDSPTFQCWTFLSQPTGPPTAPPPCSRQSQLVVTAQSATTHVGIPNAIVEISGQCLPAIGRTGLDGSVQFTTNTPDNISINVSAPNFHGAQLWYNYTYTNTSANTTRELIRYVVVTLVPYPELHVQVLAQTGAPFYSVVAGASVVVDNFTVVAVTDRTGWGNDSAVAQFNQTAIVGAYAANYSTAWKLVFIPYAGVVNTTIILLKAAYLTVAVVDAHNGFPIPGATGVVTRLDPGLPAPFPYTTDALGKFARELPLGNYSATASAVGYQTNVSGRPAFLPWIQNVTLIVRLTPAYGTNESVRLIDARTGSPIADGSVTFGADRPIPTNRAGWANATDLLPPGRIRILGTANGYFPNSTTVVLGYNTVLPPVTLKLEPACLTGCPTGPGGSGLSGSPFFPVGGSALAFLLTAPAILVVVGTLYALSIGARSGARRRPHRGPPVRGID